MKKIALVLAVLICALPMMAFAEVAVTGSVSFSLGDSTSSETTLPVYSAAKSATAAITVATDDEKVVASVGLNLLPAVTSTYNYGTDNDYGTQYDIDLKAEQYIVGWADYQQLIAVAGFWVDNDEYETAAEEMAFGDADDEEAQLLAAINAASTNVDAAYLDDDGDLAIRDAEESGAPAADVDADTEFEYTTAVGADMGAILTAATGYLDTEVDEAVATICDEADETEIDALTTVVGLVAYVNALDADDYAVLTANDKAVLAAAIDLAVAWDNITTPSDGAPTVTSAISYITSASLAFNSVGGVVDIVANLAGTHVAAGKISADGAGHTSTAVSGYPSLKLGLSSGVVEGVSAALTVYIDDNNAQEAVSDDFYTWMDETEAQADPVYGLGVMAGYAMAMGDMNVGADFTFGMYDLLGTPAWALSVAPSFSGMGANVGVQFDYGMDLMYLMASVDYTIMGITPSVGIHYASATGDNVVSYCASPASVMADYLNTSTGLLLEAGLAADLTELVGMGVSVSGSMDYDFNASQLAWGAGLSVAGLVEGLTVGFDASADAVAGSTFDYALSAAYAYSIATISASFGSAYDSGDDATYSTWSLGASVSF